MYKTLFTQKASHNRSVTASPPNGGSDYAKYQSWLRPFVVFCSATFLLLRETACAVSLSQKQKRQLPPER
ncbi:hypothetical protein [Treponema sp. R8-4-B8]